MGMALFVDYCHSHVGRVVVDIEAEQAGEYGQKTNAFAEGGFALDSDFGEAVWDKDVSGITLNQRSAEFIDFPADVLHNKGGGVIGDSHLDRAGDR